MIVLASASPRRKELLSKLVSEFSILPADIDESVEAGESPADYVIRMAGEKAVASRDIFVSQNPVAAQQAIFIGSDTSVVVDNDILGKPTDLLCAQQMLRKLSGRTHQVLTSISVLDNRFGYQFDELVVTDVEFRDISDLEIEQYWRTGEPQDKAGAYGAQGIGAVFVKSIRGSHSAVVGLPLYEMAQCLARIGYSPLQEMSHE